MNYLFDTNVLIDFFHNEEKAVQKVRDLISDSLAVSVITIAEIYHGAYQTRTPERYIEEFEQFLQDFAVKVLSLDRGVAKLAGKLQGELAKSNLRLTGFDAVIAATGLLYKHTLVTNDTVFQKIQQISVETI